MNGVKTENISINGNLAEITLTSGVAEFEYDKKAKETIELKGDKMICTAKTAAKVSLAEMEPEVQSVDYRHIHMKELFLSTKREKTDEGSYILFCSSGEVAFHFVSKEDADIFQDWVADWVSGEV